MSEAQPNPFAPPTANVEAEAPDLETSSQLASRGQRFAAAMLDGFIQMAVILPMFWAFGLWDTILENGEMSTAATAGIGVAGAVMYLVFHGYLLMTRGQSIGKVAMKIRIVDERGELVPIARLIGLRYLPFWIAANIPVIGSFVGLVDVLFIFGEDKQCLHDRIAGTMVVIAM